MRVIAATFEPLSSRRRVRGAREHFELHGRQNSQSRARELALPQKAAIIIAKATAKNAGSRGGHVVSHGVAPVSARRGPRRLAQNLAASQISTDAPCGKSRPIPSISSMKRPCAPRAATKAARRGPHRPRQRPGQKYRAPTRYTTPCPRAAARVEMPFCTHQRGTYSMGLACAACQKRSQSGRARPGGGRVRSGQARKSRKIVRPIARWPRLVVLFTDLWSRLRW